MTLMRKDGQVTVYVLKHKNSDGTWALTSLDHFSLRPGPTAEPADLTAYNAFSASGDCWQAYGIHGALDEEIGMRALNLLANKNPGTRFGLFKVELWQKTTPVAENLRYVTPHNL